MALKTDYCNVCAFFTKKTPAVVVCKTCLELYCEDCAVYHKAFRISKDHVIMKSKKGPENLLEKMAGRLSSDLEEFAISPNEKTKTQAKTMESKSKTAIQTVSSGSKGSNRGFTPSFEGEFVTREPSDVKPGFVHCITCLADDRIVFVDWNNQKLKVCDRLGHLISSQQIDYNSWGVTCIGVDEVAVTNAKQIDFYSIGTKNITRLTKRLNISCVGRGINYHNKKFVVADESGTVLVFNDQGKELAKFTSFQAFGKKIERCYDAIFDQSGENVIVADRTMGHFRVVCLSVILKKALWEIPLETKPYGMAFIGASDAMFVSSNAESVIYKVDTKTKKVEITLNEELGLYQPDGMVIQYGLGRLLVVETDCVKIFSLTQ